MNFRNSGLNEFQGYSLRLRKWCYEFHSLSPLVGKNLLGKNGIENIYGDHNFETNNRCPTTAEV